MLFGKCESLRSFKTDILLLDLYHYVHDQFLFNVQRYSKWLTWLSLFGLRNTSILQSLNNFNWHYWMQNFANIYTLKSCFNGFLNGSLRWLKTINCSLYFYRNVSKINSVRSSSVHNYSGEIRPIKFLFKF